MGFFRDRLGQTYVDLTQGQTATFTRLITKQSADWRNCCRTAAPAAHKPKNLPCLRTQTGEILHLFRIQCPPAVPFSSQVAT
jgi:hypothetical protein